MKLPAEFAHLSVAIVCAAAGLILWDVGTRTPARVLAGIMAARGDRKRVARGLARLGSGALFFAVCALLVYLAVPPAVFRWYTLVQSAVLVAGLLVELLIGDDVRMALGLHRGPGARS